MSDMHKINTLIDRLERTVATAWKYDTKLEYDEHYTRAKFTKADELMDEASQAKIDLMEAVREIIDGRG